jgi:hypothetical protein
MATDLIRYDLLVQDALRGVVRNVLSEAARNGLQGDHHFFITFKTSAPGLRLSNRMRERYPDEMTIILQHQFWDLAVTDHAFEVGLSFNNNPERLLIPFNAITSFVDPSVQFGLKFDVAEAAKPESEGNGEGETPATPARKPKTVPGRRGLTAVDDGDKKTVRPASDPVVSLKPHDIKPATPSIKPAPVSQKPVLAKVPENSAPDEKKPGEGEDTKIVSIDAFRKKP